MASLQSELSRILTDAYLDGIGEKSIEDIREMRAACQEAEVAMSYLRRLAQGRLDIVHAFLSRSLDESSVEAGDLVDDLAGILSSGPGRPAGPGRLPMLMAPDMELTGLTEELDSVLDADAATDLSSRSASELRAVAADLESIERRVSADRHALHLRIDALQSELVGRYRSGRASVDGLLT